MIVLVAILQLIKNQLNDHYDGATDDFLDKGSETIDKARSRFILRHKFGDYCLFGKLLEINQ